MGVWNQICFFVVRELLPILKTEPVTLINVVQMSKLYLSGELSVGQWRRQGM